MKNDKEMAESVFERSNKILAERAKRRKLIQKGIICVFCCCLLGLGVWKSGVLQQAPLIPDSDGQSSEGNRTIQANTDSSGIYWNGSSTNSRIPSSDEASQPTKSFPTKNFPPDDTIDGMIKVWNYKIYKLTDIQLKEADLDKQHSHTVYNKTDFIYSIKGKAMEERIAWKTEDSIYCYERAEDGIVTINNKKYGLVDRYYDSNLDQSKGSYLGTCNNMKIYEFVGKGNAVLVNIAPAIGWKDYECFYAAELLQ